MASESHVAPRLFSTTFNHVQPLSSTFLGHFFYTFFGTVFEDTFLGPLIFDILEPPTF